MPSAAPNLDRLLRHWWTRFYRVGLAEAFCCAAGGAAVAAVTVLLWIAGSAPPGALLRVLAAAAPTVLLGGCVLVGPVRQAMSRTSWTFLLAMALGWASPWWTVPRLHETWTGAGEAAVQRLMLSAGMALLNEAALIFAGAVAAVLVRFAPVRRESQVSAWLDERTGSHGLLATAAELAAGDIRPSPVQQLVIERAEHLAGRDEPFQRLSTRRLDGRWWGLLGVLLAGVGLAGWVAASLPSGPPTPPGPDRRSRSGELDAFARRQAADRLYQIEMAASAAGEAGLADSVRAASEALAGGGEPASAQAAIEQARAQAEARVAAARPLLEALGQLADQPAGTPLSAVLSNPGQPIAQAAAAASEQVGAWQAAGLSATDRARLADQLRQTAGQVAGADAELADRLNRAADALLAGDWTGVVEQIDRIVRRIQPVARGSRLAETAVRAMDEALGSVAAGGPPPAPVGVAAVPAPSDADGSPPPDDPRWHAARDAARQALQTQTLTAEQQQVVRRYFGVED